MALDGPAGSGKSTVARAVASALGWRYVDTGASYRAATLALLRSGTDLADTVSVLQVVQRADIELSSDPRAPVTRLDGEDVSSELRGPSVTAAVSEVSAIPAVRELLVRLQRQALAGSGSRGAVAEGRDVGAVVAPAAAVKIYLDARPEVRAARRAAQAEAGAPGGKAAGSSGTGAPSPADPHRTAAVAADLARRDGLDANRAASPLRQADDAVLLDTSELSFDQVVAAVVQLVRDAGLQ